MGWIVKGKELSQEEYEEYRRQQAEEKERTQDEIQRRINEVGEAFRACREFIEQHPEVHYNVKDAQFLPKPGSSASAVEWGGTGRPSRCSARLHS